MKYYVELSDEVYAITIAKLYKVTHSISIADSIRDDEDVRQAIVLWEDETGYMVNL